MEIKSIGVVGSGKMGNGIVLSAAIAGYQVVLQNRTAANLEKAKISIENQLQRLIQKKTMTVEESKATMARIQTTSTYEYFDAVDFVIESVAESLDVKHTVLAKLDAVCKKEAIIVTGTSTYSITDLAAYTQRAAQFAGMHFFLPPSKLLEITRGLYTSDETMAQAKIVAEKLGKVSVEVIKDSPGFIANRVYTPLFLEAFKVYEEGVASKEDIDLAMKCSYLPIGPFELADIIGLDVLISGLHYYHSKLGEQWNPPESLKQLVKDGRLGKKVGKGWYDY